MRCADTDGADGSKALVNDRRDEVAVCNDIYKPLYRATPHPASDIVPLSSKLEGIIDTRPSVTLAAVNRHADREPRMGHDFNEAFVCTPSSSLWW